MTSAGTEPKVEQMIESDTEEPPARRLILELSADPAEMSGTIHQDGQPDRPFAGWLELLSALEAWRGGAGLLGGAPVEGDGQKL